MRTPTSITTVPAGDSHYRVQGNETAREHEHDEVVAVGGLHIVGTERHESRRIDNQLRGRAGRQGDPGSSRFYLSLQDDLLRIFGGERMQNLMLRLGMEEDVPIESKLITKRIAAAQKAVEAQNFAARKHLLEYDDVMNKQRKAVYGLRRQLLEGRTEGAHLRDGRGIVGDFVDDVAARKRHPDTVGSGPACRPTSSASSASSSIRGNSQRSSRAEIEDRSSRVASPPLRREGALVGPEVMRETERMIMLSVIDDQWKDHLLSMDHLKEGIGLRGYGQKDPAGRVQEGVLPAVPGHDGPHRGRDRALPVLPAAVAGVRAREGPDEELGALYPGRGVATAIRASD
jgi:preprotein translocase subunit SecA